MKRAMLMVMALLALAGCDKKERVKVAQAAQKETPKEPATYTVTCQKVQSFIEATGTVQPDLEGGAKILSPLQGAVTRIYVHPGDEVRKGSILASLRSSDVSDTHSTYLSTLAQVKQAERSYQLNKKLFEIGAVTRNDLLSSEANYEQSRAIADGLKKKLDIYGASSGGGLQDNLAVRAPISGRVVDIQAHIGDRFDTATPLMTVANSARSLIVANIYDTDVGKVAKGREVSFTADVFPQQSFRGVITYVSDVEDPDSKTVKTYIKPLEGNALFKQNMFLKIRITAGERSLPVVPKSAMVFKDGKFFVQVKRGGKFEPAEVKSCGDATDKLVAVEGIKEGDVVAGTAIDMERP